MKDECKQWFKYLIFNNLRDSDDMGVKLLRWFLNLKE